MTVPVPPGPGLGREPPSKRRRYVVDKVENERAEFDKYIASISMNRAVDGKGIGETDRTGETERVGDGLRARHHTARGTHARRTAPRAGLN